MNSDPLDALLEKLTSGDAEAAEKVFVAYEPYLRMVVRRHLSAGLRAKFDSLDIVQSIWVDVLRGFRDGDWHFADAAHLRAFLVKLTHDRFIDRFRQHRQAIEREQSLLKGDWEDTVAGQDPQPSEIAEADELWQKMLSPLFTGTPRNIAAQA